MVSIAFSVVSHGQGDLVKMLLDDLVKLDFFPFGSVQIIVTLNVPENENFLMGYRDRVTLLRNSRPLGFGENHNVAFGSANADYFVVLNPDIRIYESFASHIIDASREEWGCMAPLVVNPKGVIEDNARRYPNILRIIGRVLLREKSADYDVPNDKENVSVDWVAGMFMVFRSDVYRDLKGFDQNYFMYLEDADICRRLNKAGYRVVLNPKFSIVHDARRKTFGNLIHFAWHLRSMIRFIVRI